MPLLSHSLSKIVVNNVESLNNVSKLFVVFKASLNLWLLNILNLNRITLVKETGSFKKDTKSTLKQYQIKAISNYYGDHQNLKMI